MILFYSLGFIFLILTVIYNFVWKDRFRDKNNLKKDWQKFLNSESLNDIKGITENGDKLIWNKYLLNEQLDKIIDVVNLRITEFPELKKLENNAFNKKLHYKRTLPY
ncbi:hypothetical protein [Flavobacterium sp.]|jgi:hypothetical protein|uniref:hypothetical protein n=1 Tax=Flavobacterium sp. TaxID=239 RepID=UPI002A7EB231|nr:hypothetical protein [Flavobacterium sp.]